MNLEFKKPSKKALRDKVLDLDIEFSEADESYDGSDLDDYFLDEPLFDFSEEELERAKEAFRKDNCKE